MYYPSLSAVRRFVDFSQASDGVMAASTNSSPTAWPRGGSASRNFLVLRLSRGTAPVTATSPTTPRKIISTIPMPLVPLHRWVTIVAYTRSSASSLSPSLQFVSRYFRVVEVDYSCTFEPLLDCSHAPRRTWMPLDLTCRRLHMAMGTRVPTHLLRSLIIVLVVCSCLFGC